MRLMAKSTAGAVVDKEIEQAGQDLKKSYDEVMDGLDALIKASVHGKTEHAESPKGGHAGAGASNHLHKSEQSGGEKGAKKEDRKYEEKEDLEEETEAEERREEKKLGEALSKGGDYGMEKSIVPSHEENVQELDGIEVFRQLQSDIRSMIAKAVVSIKQDLRAHVDARIAEMREADVIVAKALKVHGTMLGEAMSEMAAIGNQPKPRKSVLAVFDKSMSGNGGDKTVEQTERPNPEAIVAKAVSLSAQKKLTPQDVSLIAHYVRGGMAVPAQYAPLFAE